MIGAAVCHVLPSGVFVQHSCARLPARVVTPGSLHQRAQRSFLRHSCLLNLDKQAEATFPGLGVTGQESCVQACVHVCVFLAGPSTQKVCNRYGRCSDLQTISLSAVLCSWS